MSDKKWEIKFKDAPHSCLHEGKVYEGRGYYQLFFDGSHYGTITCEAWDNRKTGEILAFVEIMLNDAHQLALGELNKC